VARTKPLGPEEYGLSEYRYLGRIMPVAGLVVLFLLARDGLYAGGFESALGHGALVGFVVGLGLVSVLAIQMYLWREQIGRALAGGTDPRLPVGFTLGLAIYIVGLLLAAHVSLNYPGLLRVNGEPGIFALALVGGAFLPWVLMLWPVRAVARHAHKLGWEGSQKFLQSGKPPFKPGKDPGKPGPPQPPPPEDSLDVRLL
jgi:hypothetical protein